MLGGYAVQHMRRESDVHQQEKRQNQIDLPQYFKVLAFPLLSLL